MNNPDFKRLMQIGIIVRNVDEAVSNYESIGIGPWDIFVFFLVIALLNLPFYLLIFPYAIKELFLVTENETVLYKTTASNSA